MTPETDHAASSKLAATSNINAPSLHFHARLWDGHILVGMDAHPDIRTASYALRTPHALGTVFLDTWIRAFSRNAAVDVPHYLVNDSHAYAQSAIDPHHPDVVWQASPDTQPRLPTPLPESVAMHYRRQILGG